MVMHLGYIMRKSLEGLRSTRLSGGLRQQEDRFYRFDNTLVPLFPIYSPFGQDGKLNKPVIRRQGEES